MYQVVLKQGDALMLLAIIKYLICALMIVGVFVLLVSLFKNGKPIRTLLWSGISGVISLIAVVLIGRITTPMLSINIWTLLCSFGLGVPGVILMLVIKQIWGI